MTPCYKEDHHPPIGDHHEEPEVGLIDLTHLDDPAHVSHHQAVSHDDMEPGFAMIKAPSGSLGDI